MRNFFKIGARLPGYNEYINANRKGWQAGAGFKNKVQRTVNAYILLGKRSGTLHRVERPCVVHFLWTEPNRRRDVDNVQSSQKFVLDALQDSGILPNDNPKWVKQIEHHVQYDSEPSVSVWLEEEETK